MNYFVWRLPKDDFDFVDYDITKGLLRQGWGTPGLDVHNDYETFKEKWLWGTPGCEISYKRLKEMLKIKKDDIVIIPNFVSGIEGYQVHGFTIGYCTREYEFIAGIDCEDYIDTIDTKTGEPIKIQRVDYGHSIEVHLICSCIYNERSSFLAKLNGYRKRVSKVDINAQYNEKFIKTINNIIGY